tara:strand:- start:952 stop:1341 length:390 start_codon:yes stop_codon:yes gene_type:complete
MIYTYDETTGGAKRIDWDLTCSDLTKEEDKELETLIRKFLAKKPFANDIEDIDYSLNINVTGKWHDEYSDYSGVGEEYDLSELTESNIPVDFTKDQFNNLYHFINVNKDRNEYLPEILNVLKRSEGLKK